MFNSLVSRTAILYLILFLSGLGLIGLLMFRYSSKTIISSAQTNIKHQSELVEVKILEYLNALEYDINYLGNNPVLLNYLDNPSPENYNTVNNEFLALIKSKPDFSQIRYITNNQHGSEIIRVDRNGAHSFIVDKKNLQSKGDTDYFKETIKLDQDSIYFSQIDLNKEFGKISLPKTPTLRVAKSIYRNNQLEGIIVVNTNLSKLFESLKATVDNDYILRLINDEGFYILHESTDSTFLFENKTTNTSQIKIASLNSLADYETFVSQNAYHVINRVNYSNKKNGLVCFVVADKNKVLKSYYQWRKNSILILLLIGFLFMIFALGILFKQASTLKQITTRLKDFPKTRLIEDLPIKRRDEVGELAKSLSEMASIINQQIVSIEEAKNIAESAEKQKTEFIENMSHEIRNPLQSIMGLSTMLEKNNPNPNQFDILKSLKFNTSNLLGLVNNILDFQSVIKGDLSFNYEWTTIEALVEEITLGNKYAAIEKNIKLEIDIDPLLSVYKFKLDKLRISQILSNLISNAIKYTPLKGHVIVRVQTLTQNTKTLTMRFSIIDNGVGMDDNELSKIKERYFTNKGIHSLTSSFGLGLTIVHELLSAFNSKLIVTSEKNIGSTFLFELALPFKQKQSRVESISEDFVIRFDNVLIIEDDAQIVSLYKYIFERTVNNLLVLKNFDDIQGLNHDFDLVISDYKLHKHTLSDRKNDLKSIISPKTSFIIASASHVDLSNFKPIYPQVKHILKPFSNVQLVNIIEESFVELHYHLPQIEEIKKDYDYQKPKYTKALNLLIVEWSNMKTNLSQSILDNDQQKFNDVLHKLITTVRRLKISGFENYLNDIKVSLTENNFDHIKTSQNVSRIMEIYEIWFSKEL